MSLSYPIGGFYGGAVHRTKQQSKLSSKSPTRESRRGEPTPLGSLDSLVASGLSVYHQRRVSFLLRAGGSPGRRVRSGLQPVTYTTPERRNYVRTPRVAQVERFPFFGLFHPKPQYGSTKKLYWNSGTMRIRYCGFEDNRRNALPGVSIIERYAICIVPAFHRRKNTLLSGGFEWNSPENGNRSTRANISGVIV